MTTQPSTDEIADDPGSICPRCNGSGEGMADGAYCRECGGSGDSDHPMGLRFCGHEIEMDEDER